LLFPKFHAIIPPERGVEMVTGITVDSKGVVIPLEMLDAQGEGIAVLTLAPGAYLIMRSEMLAAYPR
jgi:hypothetical protein